MTRLRTSDADTPRRPQTSSSGRRVGTLGGTAAPVATRGKRREGWSEAGAIDDLLEYIECATVDEELRCLAMRVERARKV